MTSQTTETSKNTNSCDSPKEQKKQAKRPSGPWYTRGDGRLIYEFLPEDSSRQTSGLHEALSALHALPSDGRRMTLIDLGCGVGSSYDAFSTQNSKIRWVGLDILDSPEANAKPRRALPFCTYDGILIPLSDQSADMVYCRQVFEHVRHPERLLSEIHRVLKPDGLLVGSTSHLEPFHSRSFWNFTPYGFCVLLRDAGFHLLKVRPGIDSLTLIVRRFFAFVGLARLLSPFFRMESPLNLLLEMGLRLLGRSVQTRNAVKLLFAGHFCFYARK